MDSKITIGGQALIEGVMMRSNERYAIAVRRPDKKISIKLIPVQKAKYGFMNWPLLRGFFRFIETLMIGINSLSYSATESQGEKEESLSKKDLVLTLFISIGMTFGLFYFLPLLLTKFITDTRGFYFNLIDGVLRLAIFLIYLSAISFMPDIRRVFQYHGAEHKAVYCYESKKPLTVKNVQKFSTLHPRCGTNFILIVFVLSIFFFTIVNVQGFFYKLALRILMLPIIAGFSYEVLKFAGNHFENPIVKAIIWPGLMLQKITTKEPEDDMVEVAIKSLKAVL
ncbi:MAG: DUF1385 domain-containing protein [Candidatus Woesearchaeota archaeon]|nr:DUF1385 domain-containing protein [Candidatus Woesearchaeota archaeon]